MAIVESPLSKNGAATSGSSSLRVPNADSPQAGASNTIARSLADDLHQGLSRTPKTIPSMYFYDARGSRLFQQISELEEYYPTACEFEILGEHSHQIADLVASRPFRLIELGAGDGRKTKVLLEEFLRRGLEFEYAPIDICGEAIDELTESMTRALPQLEGRIHGVVAEYVNALSLLSHESNSRNVVLFLGSNIGNFDPPTARRFLRGLRRALNPGDLVLMGVDLKKDVEVLMRAYNDSQGITREFNFNMLDRINRELRADFHRDRFDHYGPYNALLGCMESWLISRQRQDIRVRATGNVYTLEPWEGILVERSYKYGLDDIEILAAATGFKSRELFLDRRRYFADALWVSQ